MEKAILVSSVLAETGVITETFESRSGALISPKSLQTKGNQQQLPWLLESRFGPIPAVSVLKQ
jgi:hypothetical protein